MWKLGRTHVLLDDRPMALCTGKERLKKFIRECIPLDEYSIQNIHLLRKAYGLTAV